MAFGVYVHIPYCLQRCRYCDFVTFEHHKILPPELYVDNLIHELRLRRHWAPPEGADTLYFGGGTPSLLDPKILARFMAAMNPAGLFLRDGAEVTLEINPATLTEDKLNRYLEMGINRFSVGAQTFEDRLLRACDRRHTSTETLETLELLRSRNLNYSLDLLFALPGQSLMDLEKDLAIIEDLNPPHLSAYCLTVPEGHPMAGGRPLDEVQEEMFQLISNRLEALGLNQYEISNYARPGFESQHNLIYWTDGAYLGLGVGAHSYLPIGPWGKRFWNPSKLETYLSQASSVGDQDELPRTQQETLSLQESLTDFCHTHLRLNSGLSANAVRAKYGGPWSGCVAERLSPLLLNGLVESLKGPVWRLTESGRLMSNRVFAELLFLESEASTVQGPAVDIH